MPILTFQRLSHWVVQSRPFVLYIDGERAGTLSPDDETTVWVNSGYHSVWFRFEEMSSNEILIALWGDFDTCRLACAGEMPSLQSLCHAVINMQPFDIRFSLQRRDAGDPSSGDTSTGRCLAVRGMLDAL